MSEQPQSTGEFDHAEPNAVPSKAPTQTAAPTRRPIPALPSLASAQVPPPYKYNGIDSVIVPDGFECRHDGIYGVDGENPFRLTTRPTWMANMLRGHQGKDWSFTLRFVDADGHTKDVILPFQILARPDSLSDLSSEGLLIFPRASKEFARFLTLSTDVPAMPRIRLQRTLGFFREPTQQGQPDAWGFMMPERCYWPHLDQANSNDVQTPPYLEDIRFCPERESRAHSAYRASGSLEDWQALVRPLASNPMLVFALCVAMAGPFQTAAGLDNVIFHLFGDSSTGKTTALQLAVTVWGCGLDPQSSGGRPTLIERWNATSNAMEPLAAAHSGIFLAIDELGSSGDLTVSVYNVTSGRGKARMQKIGGLRSADIWTLFILSAGEFSMQEKIESTTKRKAKTGEIIRAMDIPVGALSTSMGMDMAEERAMVEHLKARCGDTFGTAGPALIQSVLNHFKEEQALSDWLNENSAEYFDKLLAHATARGRTVGPAHKRAMRRFAFVGAVGVLASGAGIIPFDEGVIESSILAVSDAWLSSLPPLSEGQRAFESIRSYVLRLTSQILDFDAWKRQGCDPAARPQNMRAIRKRGYILFNGEQLMQACGGASTRSALAYLREKGLLHCEDPTKFTTRISMVELDVRHHPFHAIDAAKLLSGLEDNTEPQTDDDEQGPQADEVETEEMEYYNEETRIPDRPSNYRKGPSPTTSAWSSVRSSRQLRSSTPPLSRPQQDTGPRMLPKDHVDSFGDGDDELKNL